MKKYSMKDINIFESNAACGKENRKNVNDVLVMAFVYNKDKTKIKVLPEGQTYDLNGVEAKDFLVQKYSRENCLNIVRPNLLWCVNAGVEVYASPLFIPSGECISELKLKMLLDSHRGSLLAMNRRTMKHRQKEQEVAKVSEDTRNF